MLQKNAANYMYSNNLTELLKTFSIKETKEFRVFLNSSYFNSRQAVNNLYDIIIKFHPDFENKSLTKEIVFDKLFPGKKYNDSSLRVLSHYLIELAEKFLAVQRFESNELEFSIQLQTVLNERNQNKLFEKNMGKAFGSLDKSKIDAEELFFYKFRLENLMMYNRFASNYGYLDKVIAKSTWEHVFKDLKNYYLFKSMIMYLNTLSLQYMYSKNYSFKAFKSLISKIKPEDYEDIPVIKLYYYLIKLKTDSKHESHYFKLKGMIFQTKKDLNKYDLMGAYVHMGLYCIDMISKGKTNFERERFDLYKEEISEKTYLMSDNSMAPMFYRNVVDSAITLNEFSWVKNFIHTYKPELNKKFRENYFYYCLALYEFSMKNFEYSLELISKIKYDEIYMKLKSKVLHLQILYELGYEDSLVSSLESFRHFLNNNKLIPQEKKAPHYNFQKYLNRIISTNMKRSKSDKDLLLHNISKETILTNKNWLMEIVR